MKYEVVGELSEGGRPGARTLLAKSAESGESLLLIATKAPESDQGNALNHLAADANLLAGATHRNLLPVRGGEWLNETEFGLITQRVNVPTLADLLNRRDEEFDYTRIAHILSEVNGLLEWARTRRVVHRRVTPQSLFVEPGSDR